LVAIFGTLGFECECLLFPADVELYDPSCNINRGFGGTQDGCLLLDTAHFWEAILEYHKVHGTKKILILTGISSVVPTGSWID
jgi:hypothetical protein